jgi:apolipoprotein N-acyltransferase
MHGLVGVLNLAPAERWPQRIILSEGWARRAIAFSSGALGALALEPFGWTATIAVPLVVAVWLIDGAAGEATSSKWRENLGALRSAAVAGWWMGFGYFLAGLWWLGAALLVEADQFAWALPLAVLGVPAGLAVFTALGFGLSRLLWSERPLRVLALAAGLGAAEWLRGRILTGFPWNDFGLALANTPVLAQSGALIGLHGLDLLAISIFATPATLFDEPRHGWRSPAPLFAIGVLALMTGYGALRLAANSTDFVPGVKLRLMQPNLQQDAKFQPSNGRAILSHYLELSDRATGPTHTGIGDATHIIWPESAFPFVLTREPAALSQIAHALQGKILITGAARAEDGRGRSKIFNSILALQGERVVGAYDKMHLVPFGEYLPLGALLRPFGVQHLVPGVWDEGAGPRKLSVPGLPPIAPLICYEAIFPGEATAGAGQRPELLLNVTNDGWFGKTSGPYQHFAQARLRAVEEGLPLVRVANTGISAIVDPYGRVLESLPLGVEGVLDGPLPKAAAPTTFSKHPKAPFAILWTIAVASALLGKYWRSLPRR